MDRNKTLDKLFCNKIPDQYMEEFNQRISAEVIIRGKTIAITIASFELVLLAVVWPSNMEMGGHRPLYIGMYLSMVFVMLMYLLQYKHLLKTSIQGTKRQRIIVVFYISFLLFWSAGLSIIDQLSNNQIIVYLITTLAIGVFGNLKPRVLLGLLASCQLSFVVMLLLIEQVPSVVFSNFVNSTIFVSLSWVIARSIYKNKIEDFLNDKLIVEKNEALNEINTRLNDSNSQLNETNIQLQETNMKLKEANDKLELLSITDPMSGLYNRRKFDEAIKQEWDRRKRYQEFISLIFIDIDYFKLYNDNYGHQSGDVCIRRIAETIMNNSRRASDIAARYGGEEFVVVIPRTDPQAAYETAENIRMSVEKLQIPHAYSAVSEYVSVSAGVYTTIPNNVNSVEEFIDRVDQALYKAKSNGRNQVVAFHENPA